jgi:hypothetical protein
MESKLQVGFVQGHLFVNRGGQELRIINLAVGKPRENLLNLLMGNMSNVAVVCESFFHLLYRDDARVAGVYGSECISHCFEIDLNVTSST